MIIQKLIDKVDKIYPNAFDLQEKLDWINEIEGLVCTELNKNYSYLEAVIDKNDAVLSLPEGIRFEDIECVFLNGRQIAKKDFRSYSILGAGDSFMVSRVENPMTIRAVYIARHNPVVRETVTDEITLGNSTITFSSTPIPFAVGDTVEISSSETASNNKQVVLLEIEDNIATVPENSFTFGTETLTVTTVLNQTLRVAPPYDKLYLEYLQAKIDQYNRDFEAYQNNMIVFNTSWVSYA